MPKAKPLFTLASVCSLTFRCLGALILLCVGMSQTLSVELDDVNVGRVLIENQSSAMQKAAGREALEQVFVKLSGSKRVLNEASIKRAVVNYERYLIASSYSTRQDALVFEASFNEDKLLSLLQNAGLPVWAKLRPSATVWMYGVFEEDEANQTATSSNDDSFTDTENTPAPNVKEASWLTQNSSPEFSEALQIAAFERGVRMILPLGDLRDRMSVSEFDVASLNSRKLLRQSQRYDTPLSLIVSFTEISEQERDQYRKAAQFKEEQAALDALLNSQNQAQFQSEMKPKSTGIAKVPSDDDRYILEVLITDAQQLVIHKSFVPDASSLATRVVEIYVDWLVEQFAVSNSASTQTSTGILHLSNLNSILDYQNALDLINSLPQVTDSKLRGFSGNTAIIQLSVQNELRAVIPVLTLDKRLSVEDSSDQLQAIDLSTTTLIEPSIHLRWNGGS